jgi:hypothetical protein
MDKRVTTQVFGITADDKVTLHTHGQGDDIWHTLVLPGEVTLFFDGNGADDWAALLGFLDRMCAIRNAVLQDRADAKAVAS